MNPRTRTSLPAVLFLTAAAITSLAGHPEPQPPAALPTPAPASNPPPAPAEETKFVTADDLLKALERADENLTSLTADIRYDRTFELQGDRQVRTGKLYFVSGTAAPAAPADASTPPAQRKFAVSFKNLIVGDSLREEPKIYIFDGQWLVEKYSKETPPLFIKRQVVQPGQKFDPLRIGEGPFPLPIGQKASDIKSRFATELVPASAGLEPGADADEQDKLAATKLVEFVAGTSQLRLTPKAEFASDEEFTEIRLWYKRDAAGVLLPRMARTLDKNKNISVVQLINVAVQRTGEPPNAQAAVPPEMLDTQQPVSGWDVQVIPWQKSADAAAGSGSGGPARREGADAGDP